MKIIVMLTFCLVLNNFALAQVATEQRPIEENDITKFNNRLETIYGQADQDTPMQQVVFGSLEAIAAYKLSSLVTPVDQKKIAALSTQIKAFKDPATAKMIGGELYSENHRLTKLRSLQRELKTVEGGIIKRMSRGSAKIFVRGAQVFLILDVGARLYILNTLDNRDPGFIPTYTFLCSQVDCADAVEEVIDVSNDAYIEARQALRPRRSPPPEETEETVPEQP